MSTLALMLALAAPAVGAGSLTSQAPPSGETRAPASNEAWARAAVASMPRATTDNDRDGNKLFDDLDLAYAAAPGERLPVIVSFVDGTQTADGLARATAVAPSAPVRRAFTLIPAYAGDLSHTEALRVAALPEVRQIELDREGTPELDTATEVMGANEVVDELGVTGSLDGMPDVATTDDVGIAVLDTGIFPDHPDLGDKIVAWHDFGSGSPEPYDPNGHGTHVASIAAGWGIANPDFRGVAPGASLIGLKIDGGGTTSSNAIAAYEWVVEHAEEYNIRVATISFGFGIATDGTTALERAVDATWDAGVVTTKSNGNSGPDYGTMTVPAAARGILAIGSVLDPFGASSSKFGFTLSEWSSRGPTSDGRIKPDLVAPGESIRAANTNAGGYTVKSGTSMAAPFAAGTAALMVAADPSLTPDEVRDLLIATAEDRGAEGPDNDFGHGRIQVWQAVAAVLDGVGEDTGDSTPPAVPAQESLEATADTGIHEHTFTVTDTAFPVAATILSGQLVLAAEIYDSEGERVAALTATPNLATRQHHYTFQPSEPGDFELRIVVPPGADLVVDLSHSLTEPQ